MQDKILITGIAGFIGFHLTEALVKKGYEVVGLDNINDYYDPQLKYDRLSVLGFDAKACHFFNERVESTVYEKLSFIRLNLEDRQNLPVLFKKEKFDVVVNLAAQAGVRYSIENPEVYVDSNIVGFLNILECCRNNSIKKLVYASSSSVYGENSKVPFSTEDRADCPVSLYASTKRSNELMAYSYSHLYDFQAIGLRFFTVYGPWGRPDMAMFLFTNAIDKGEPIKVFNNGDLERDFTFIGDIVKGITAVVEKNTEKQEKHLLYNIGNSKPVRLMEFINQIEKSYGKQAPKKMMPMQPGDVKRTWADVDSLQHDFGYNPNTPIAEGIERFVNWFRSYYGNRPK